MGGKQGRPVIGLTTIASRLPGASGNMSADLLPSVYTRSVEAAGGVVMLLCRHRTRAWARLSSRLDGLSLPVARTSDPERYGKIPHPMTKVRRDRDAWEFGLLDAADRLVFRRSASVGECRSWPFGRRFAGTASADVVGHEEHAPGGNAFGWTSISTREGSRGSNFRR
jgi:putative glutamine amidotransferase